MSTENKNMAIISYVKDTDVSYYKTGEVHGAFDENELKDYIKSYGHEKLCERLTFLQYQVWTALRAVNAENSINDINALKNP